MKLIGSLIEQQFRGELINSWHDIQANQKQIISLLSESFSPINIALTLNWVPDQLEDIYTILVNGEHVVTLELPKVKNTPPSVAIETKAEYEKSLTSRHKRIQLAVALAISNEFRHQS